MQCWTPLPSLHQDGSYHHYSRYLVIAVTINPTSPQHSIFLHTAGILCLLGIFTWTVPVAAGNNAPWNVLNMYGYNAFQTGLTVVACYHQITLQVVAAQGMSQSCNCCSCCWLPCCGLHSQLASAFAAGEESWPQPGRAQSISYTAT